MYPVSDAFKTAVKNKAKQKILLEFHEITLTNDDISMDGGLEYTEILNGDTDLNAGRAVMSSLSVRLINNGQLPESIYTGEFTAKIGVLTDFGYEYVPLGVFTPEKPQKIKSKYVDLQAYDRMKKFDVDASTYLENLGLYDNPKTAGEIFVEICNLCGVGYVSDTFRHDWITLNFDTFRNKEVTFREILAWIAECGGNYARISRDGLVEMVTFAEQDHVIAKAQMFEATVSERITPVIDKLEVYTTYTDILTESGDGNNLYQIIDNPFLYAENDGEVNGVTNDIYGWLYSIPEYYPASVRVEADPSVQCGDIIRFVDDGTEKILPVFTQTLTWNGYAKAVYESTGQPKRSNLPTEQRMLAGLKKEFVRKTDLSATIDSYLSTEEGKAAIIQSVSGEFVTVDAITGYAKESYVNAAINSTINYTNAQIDLTAEYGSNTIGSNVRALLSLVANPDSSSIHLSANAISLEAVPGKDGNDSTTPEVSGADYGFSLGYLGSFNGYVSGNTGIDSSAAVARINLSGSTPFTLTMRVCQSSEYNFDFGIIYPVDYVPGLGFNDDLDTGYKSFKGDSNTDTQIITMEIPAGEHFVYIKYRKDGSASEGNDGFGFWVESTAAGDGTYLTLSSGGIVLSSANITIEGVVTFTDLSTAGSTVINGANITTDNLYVETVWATNENDKHHAIMRYSYIGNGNSLEMVIGRNDDDIIVNDYFYTAQYMNFYANYYYFNYIDNTGTYEAIRIDTAARRLYASGYTIYCSKITEGY